MFLARSRKLWTQCFYMPLDRSFWTFINALRGKLRVPVFYPFLEYLVARFVFSIPFVILNVAIVLPPTTYLDFMLGWPHLILFWPNGEVIDSLFLQFCQLLSLPTLFTLYINPKLVDFSFYLKTFEKVECQVFDSVVSFWDTGLKQTPYPSVSCAPPPPLPPVLASV